MDPITGAIIAALVAGATQGPAADTYQALKAAIQRKHGPHSALAEALDKLEQRPNSAGWKEELATQVQATHAAQDPQLLSLAQDLIAALKKTPTGQQTLGKYEVQVQGGQVGVIGDRAHVEGGIHFGGSGDTFNMSGDFRGSIVNVKSKLEHVTQTIGALPDTDPEAKAKLKSLVQGLNNALQKVPSDKGEDAEAVAKSAELLVETATQGKPNRTMIQITGDGLKKAAQNLADVAPTVLNIATQIVETIDRIVR